MIPFRSSVARSALGGLTAAALLTAVALPAEATLSASAAVFGTSSHSGGGLPATTTDVAGQVVQQLAFGESFYRPPPSFDEVVLGAVNGSGRASVDYGVNRIALNTGFLDLRSQAGSNPNGLQFGYTQGSVQSTWSDSWNIGGGAPGDLVSISLFGRTTYQFAITGIAGITDRRAFHVAQSVSVSTRPDFGQVLLETADFVANAGVGFIDWSFTFTGTVGVPLNVNGTFSASSSPTFDVSIGTRDYDVTYGFNSFNTSKLQRIELPVGYTLSAESGEIVVHDGAFAYRAALIPEPQTWALLLVGLIALCWRAKSRQG